MSSGETPAVEKNLTVIECLAQQDLPIPLTRFFRGLLIHQDVQILSVCPDFVVFRAGDISSFATAEGHVYLHPRGLPKPVRGRLQNCIIDTCTFVLSDFNSLETEWKERSDDRVQPRTPTSVSLRGSLEKLNAALADIQLSGIGVYAKQRYQEEGELVPHASVQIDCQLTPMIHLKNLAGTILNVEPISSALVRIGIQLLPNPSQARSVKKYIARRKEEILGELDQTYQRALGPRRVEDLYF